MFLNLSAQLSAFDAYLIAEEAVGYAFWGAAYYSDNPFILALYGL